MTITFELKAQISVDYDKNKHMWSAVTVLKSGPKI